MISLVRICVLENICTRWASSGSMQVFREARMLDKMIKKKIMQTKSGDNVPKKLKQGILASAYANEGSNRKIAALNKFYMEQIIDLITSGPFNNEINELGIEFTKVKMSSCRSSIKIFWILNKPEMSESVTIKLLQDIRTDIQAQMGFLRSMRKVPLITFCKDLRLERHNIVEKLLEVADFGKDFQPSSARKVVISERPHSNELQETENPEDLKMRQNVLGLDHAKIKEKLMQKLKKFQAINLKKNEVQEITHEYTGKLAVFSKKLFISFYKRKLYLDKKLRTRESVNSFIEFDEPYDPDEEADKYWECFKFKDDLIDGEEEHETKDNGDQNYDTDEEDNSDDNYCEESNVHDPVQERHENGD